MSAVKIDSFFAGKLEEAAVAVVERGLSGKGGYACLANVHVVVSAGADPELRAALDDAWAVFPDGWPVAWLLRRLDTGGAARIAGPDLMPAVFDRGRDVTLRHFLFGSTEDVLDRLVAQLLALYPDARIVGRLAPPFGESSPADQAAALAAIAAARPHVVWCALGAPKQELWMQKNASSLAPAVVLGVGAAFDFVAGTKPRAPRLAQALGLEWLHRLVTEPRRLWRRYARTNTAFALVVMSTLLRERVLNGQFRRRRHELPGPTTLDSGA